MKPWQQEALYLLGMLGFGTIVFFVTLALLRSCQ